MTTWEAGKAGYTKLWATCTVLPSREKQAEAIARKLMAPSAAKMYAAVAARVPVPAYVVAAIHWRESSGDFSTQLWQGDPLDQVSRHEPAGKGPYKSWVECAVEAIAAHLEPGLSIDSPAKGCWFTEKFNGFGYVKAGENTPYVWAWTNHQQPGKYVRDHQYDPNFIDPQPGCAAIWRAMEALGSELEQLPATKETTVAQTVTTPADHDAQLNAIIQRVEQAAGFLKFATGIIPGRWGRLAQLVPLLVEDAARWITAARSASTSAADVKTLIDLTASHVGQVPTLWKDPAST